MTHVYSLTRLLLLIDLVTIRKEPDVTLYRLGRLQSRFICRSRKSAAELTLQVLKG